MREGNIYQKFHLKWAKIVFSIKYDTKKYHKQNDKQHFYVDFVTKVNIHLSSKKKPHNFLAIFDGSGFRGLMPTKLYHYVSKDQGDPLLQFEYLQLNEGKFFCSCGFKTPCLFSGTCDNKLLAGKESIQKNSDVFLCSDCF